MTMIAVLLALFNAALQSGPAQNPTAPAYKVVGYYADWTAERYPLVDIPADKLTHVNYAFGKIDAENKLTFNRAIAIDRVYPGDCGEPQCPHGLFHQITIFKEKHPHLKFILSV
jgi:chitinase